MKKYEVGITRQQIHKFIVRIPDDIPDGDYADELASSKAFAEAAKFDWKKEKATFIDHNPKKLKSYSNPSDCPTERKMT